MIIGMHAHVLDFFSRNNFKRTFQKNTLANVMLKFGISLTRMDLDSPLYHKTLTRNEGSGFVIMFIVTFSTT